MEIVGGKLFTPCRQSISVNMILSSLCRRTAAGERVPSRE